MKEKFLIDDLSYEIDVLTKNFFRIPIEVTTHSDSWEHYIPDGNLFLELTNKLKDQTELRKLFLVIDIQSNPIKLKTINH